MRRGRLAVALATTCLAAAACTNSQSPRASEPQASAGAVTASAGADGVQRVTVDGDDRLRFTPDVVVAHPGRITLTLHDAGNTPHNVSFLGPLRASTPDADAGESRSVTFTVGSPGTYQFVCTYHRSLGMVGRLVVR